MASTFQLVSQKGYKQVTFVCRMCETQSTSTYIFTEPIVCVDCGKRIKNLETSTDGIIVNNKKHYVCKICIKFFSSLYGLRKHVKTIHESQKRLYTCFKCGNSFICKYNLEKHMEVHTRTWYQCPTCSRRFTQLTLLLKHKKLHLNMRAHLCNICGQTFASIYYLKQHSLLHLDYRNRKFQCKTCFKYFASKQYLTLHTKRAHSNDRPYKCACGKTYKYRKTLKDHIKTSKRKYLHSECGEQFLSSSDSYAHGSVSTSLRPYECDTCKKTFKRKDDIKQHVEIHLSRKKVYMCLVCDKRFFTKSDLNKHEIVHSSVRPYECDICKRTFKRKHNLKRHVEIHLFRKTPYVFSYLSKRSLDGHIKTHSRHPVWS